MELYNDIMYRNDGITQVIKKTIVEHLSLLLTYSSKLTTGAFGSETLPRLLDAERSIAHLEAQRNEIQNLQRAIAVVQKQRAKPEQQAAPAEEPTPDRGVTEDDDGDLDIPAFLRRR